MKARTSSTLLWLITISSIVISLYILWDYFPTGSEIVVRNYLNDSALVSFIYFAFAFFAVVASTVFPNRMGRLWRRSGIYFFWGFIASHTAHLYGIIYLGNHFFDGDFSQLGSYHVKAAYLIMYVLFIFSIKPIRKRVGDIIYAEYSNYAVYFLMFIFTYSFFYTKILLTLLAWILIIIRGVIAPGVNGQKIRQRDQSFLPW
ncbi:MAG: hypothetical protein ACEPOV_06810 [Hyphomicrobiales bacterium]